MNLSALDHLAASVAAGLHDSPLSSDEVAARAYEIATALLQERSLRDGGSSAALIEALPHHPEWETEPRWNAADRRAARAALARLNQRRGPGLARGSRHGQDGAAQRVDKVDKATG